MARSEIIGSGFVTGEHLVTNDDLTRLMDTTDAWIRERSGIEQRYYVKDGTTTSDLGARAAERALADAGVRKEEVDYIVVATMTPDYYFPGIGGLIQKKLGMTGVPALDLRQQCTGFIYGLQVADALVRAGVAKTVLLIGAEIHSGFIPWKHWDYLFGLSSEGPTPEDRAFNSSFRDRAVLFGDAAGAVVLRPGAEAWRGVLGIAVHSSGESVEDLYVPTGGFAFRPYMQEAHIRESRQVPAMNGRSVYRMAVRHMPQVVREVCAQQGVRVEDIDLLIAHQANLRINEAVQKALGLSDERVYNNIQRYGNTTAATIPIAYHECRKAGRIKPGDLVCFVGLGSGFHWGAALVRH
jgi:3-oxoacyl-[acyl-carrier-protein] synthase-3